MDKTTPYTLYVSTTMTDVTKAITAKTLTPFTLTTPTSATISLGASSFLTIFVVVAKSEVGTQSFALASLFPASATTTSPFSINSYATVLDPSPTGTTLHVDITTGFSVGDEILVLQTQAQKNSGGNTLNREFSIIQGVDSTSKTITLSAPLVNAYTSGASNKPQSTVTQVVSVPHFVNFILATGQTLAATAWAGTKGKGGVLVFRDSGTTIINGNIDVTGKGFQGGKRVTRLMTPLLLTPHLPPQVERPGVVPGAEVVALALQLHMQTALVPEGDMAPRGVGLSAHQIMQTAVFPPIVQLR